MINAWEIVFHVYYVQEGRFHALQIVVCNMQGLLACSKYTHNCILYYIRHTIIVHAKCSQKVHVQVKCKTLMFRDIGWHSHNVLAQTRMEQSSPPTHFCL